MTVEQIAGLIAREIVSKFNIKDDEGRKAVYENALNTVMKETLIIVSPEGKLVEIKA